MITQEYAAVLTEELRDIRERTCGDHGPAIEKLCQILADVIGCLDHV